MDKLKLLLKIEEDENNLEELNETTLTLRNLLLEFNVESIGHVKIESINKGAKGDAFTIGSLLLVVAPAILPQIFDFLKVWAIDRRKISIESPNGAKIEFVPNKKYSEEEIMNFLNKLNSINKN